MRCGGDVGAYRRKWKAVILCHLMERSYRFGDLKIDGIIDHKVVSVHRARHLLRYRALEVQQYVGVPEALQLQHPVNAYRARPWSASSISIP